MYRVQYFCPRQSPYWQDFTESVLLIFRQPKQFPNLAEAVRTCKSLVWQYHAARVVDYMGNQVYSV